MYIFLKFPFKSFNFIEFDLKSIPLLLHFLLLPLYYTVFPLQLETQDKILVNMTRVRYCMTLFTYYTNSYQHLKRSKQIQVAEAKAAAVST